MKKEELMAAIGNVSTEQLDRCEHQLSRKAIFLRIGAAAACLLIVAVAAFSVWKSGLLTRNDLVVDCRWQKKEVVRVSSTTPSEIAKVPEWNEMNDSQRYSELTLSGIRYSTRNTEIPAEKRGEERGSVVGHGYDIYTETDHSATATLYAISGISTECAAAVRFEGNDACYAYVNSWYVPENLGAFLDDLNLRENVSFGSAYYNLEQSDGSTTTIEFTDLPQERVFEMLLSDESLVPLEDPDRLTLNGVMSVGVDIPLLGYHNITLGVTEDGYLFTNILDTAKVFDIGKEKAQQFVNYVIDNCTGYELVYVEESMVEE